MGGGGRIWFIILRGKDGRGRADGKPGNPQIPAGCFRFGTDEPEGGELRAVSACTAEPVHGTISVGFAGISGAHCTGRALFGPKLFLFLRAHIQIQNRVHTGPVRSKTCLRFYACSGGRLGCQISFFRQSTAEVQPSGANPAEA